MTAGGNDTRGEGGEEEGRDDGARGKEGGGIQERGERVN